jgi:hypothetical protein
MPQQSDLQGARGGSRRAKGSGASTMTNAIRARRPSVSRRILAEISAIPAVLAPGNRVHFKIAQYLFITVMGAARNSRS